MSSDGHNSLVVSFGADVLVVRSTVTHSVLGALTMKYKFVTIVEYLRALVQLHAVSSFLRFGAMLQGEKTLACPVCTRNASIPRRHLTRVIMSIVCSY